MDVLQRIDINLFTTFFLGIVLYLAYHRLDHKNAFNRLFFKGCILIMTMIVFEALTCVFNKNPSVWIKWISTVMHIFLFSVAPLITFYWYLLADTMTLHGNVRDIKPKWLYLIPVALVFVITVLSPVFHFVFYIDGNGVYHRGYLFIVDMIVTYAYLLLGFLLTIKRRKNLTGMDFLFLILICLMPIVGGLIQGLVYGILLMWGSSACSLMIMYLYLQERMMQTDYQTGAWTRHSFEYSISQRLKSNDNKPFGMAYVDIDNLKHINDQYGHQEGDDLIKATVKVIRSVLRKGDEIARLGGDEFAIVLDLYTHEDLHKVIERINSAICQYNENSGKEYSLSISLGADLFSDNADISVEAIINKVDHLMYVNKRFKKQVGTTDLPPKKVVQ